MVATIVDTFPQSHYNNSIIQAGIEAKETDAPKCQKHNDLLTTTAFNQSKLKPWQVHYPLPLF